MPDQTLYISVIQPDIAWEDKPANLRYYEACFQQLPDQRHIVLLPEMCTTGFSMNAEGLSEAMDGPSVQWLKDMAIRHRCIIAGSFIIAEEGKYYNRLIWMQPDGQHYSYDKRHLFGYALEDQYYTGGQKKLIVQVNGWRVCPLVCYDLRFPVWSRNTGDDYDVLIYVANWPARRAAAWNTLLPSRAIENQSYCIGVNRTGIDGFGYLYNGDSGVYGPLGNALWQAGPLSAVHTVGLSAEHLNMVRESLPFLKDADRFLLV